MWYSPSVPFPASSSIRATQKGKPDLIYCGDNEGAKYTTAGLIRDASFNPVDMGPLSTARYAEPFLLVAQLAYNSSDDPALQRRCGYDQDTNLILECNRIAPSRVADVKSRYRPR